jgi:small-conductance mechanosensitive channel
MSGWIIWAIFLWIVLWGYVPSGQAISEPLTQLGKKKPVEPITSAQIEKKIESLKDRIKLAKTSENEQTAKQMGVTMTDLHQRTTSLRAIQSAYERLLTALKKQAAQEEEKSLLNEKLKAQDQIRVAQKPPFNLSFYDSVLDELAVAEHQEKTAALAAKLSQKTLEDASSSLEKAQKEWRNLKDQLEAVSKEERNQKLKWDLEKAELEKELSEGLVNLEKANRDNMLKQVKLAELRVELSRRKIGWVRMNLHFDEADLARQVETLETKKTELEKRVQRLVRKQKKAEEAWLLSQERSTSAFKERSDPVVEAVMKEHEAWRNTYQAVLEQTEDMLQLLAHEEQVWRLRYALIKGGMGHKEIMGQIDKIEKHIENINRILNVQQSYQANLQSEITALEKKLAEQGLRPAVSQHLKNKMKALRTAAGGRFEYISLLLETEQMDRRVLGEIGMKLKGVSLRQRFTNLKSELQKIWGFEVWVIDNRPVTVRKLIVTLLILIIGILVAKYLLRTIARRVLPHTPLKETTASAIQKLFTYFAYLLILILALRIVNIPLAAFAFLGGAIAIGFGFGAQNLINNFISGFIIMGERPINIGDIIEVEGVLGKVEEIGARCTRIRTGENIHILVPNSSFLEKNITNWTLSDQKIRAYVTAGVIYGSPVQEVERLLLKAVSENEKVLKEPEPFVLFNDFGDNALVFQVHFWISIRRIIERRLIESSVRFRIDELFREAGIVIAFPQRDVHLDAKQPLEFRLIEKAD